jgi:hypothetical protein
MKLMANKKTFAKAPLFISVGFVTILLAVSIVMAMQLKASLPQQPDNVPPASKITPGPVTLEGRATCLPKKPGPDGSSTMECVYGFQNANGEYYLLKDPAAETDPEWFMKPLYTAARIRVEGTVTSETSEAYYVVGTLIPESYVVLQQETNDRIESPTTPPNTTDAGAPEE